MCVTTVGIVQGVPTGAGAKGGYVHMIRHLYKYVGMCRAAHG